MFYLHFNFYCVRIIQLYYKIICWRHQNKIYIPLHPWLSILTREHKDQAGLPLSKHAWQIPYPINLIFCVITQCIRGTRLETNIETSVITWHKTQDSTLNIYGRPKTNLRLISCLCVAVSLYSALQVVVLRMKRTKKSEAFLHKSEQTLVVVES